MSISSPTAIGLDFGTTNSVVALSQDNAAELVALDAPDARDPVFRSALCFWEDDGRHPGVPSGLAADAGPWAIREYLEYPQDSRFLQSFKSVVASASFEFANVFERRLRFEELGQLFLAKLAARAGGALDGQAARVVVGRPVEFDSGDVLVAELLQAREGGAFEFGLGSPPVRHGPPPASPQRGFAARRT